MVKNTENKEVLEKLQELEAIQNINVAVIRREEYKRAQENLLLQLPALLRESMIFQLIHNREEYRLNKSVIPKLVEDCSNRFQINLTRTYTNYEKRSYGRRRIWSRTP